MALCSAPSGLDLFDPRWPIRTAAQSLPAARVTLDEVGHPGQALNVLMAEGAMIRGGAAIRCVLGHSVTIESGAEVEDSVLFDGARVRRGACVRRAIVGPGAVVEEGQHLGYGDEPRAASPLPSGLVLLPATSPLASRAAAAR
jgi:glucose-1-phosphate adenylyltransferase